MKIRSYKEGKRILFAYIKHQKEVGQRPEVWYFKRTAFCPYCKDELEENNLDINLSRKVSSDEHNKIYEARSLIKSLWHCSTCKNLKKDYTYTSEQVLFLPVCKTLKHFGYDDY